MFAFKKKQSILVNYFISYFSIALLSCSIVGLLLCFLSVSELKTESRQTAMFKTQLALDDLENQYSIMQQVSQNIYIKPVYKASYFKRNKYYELELLDDFVRYINRAVLTSSYFLSYTNDNRVFLSTGTTLDARLYYESTLGASDGEAFSVHLKELDLPKIFPLEKTDKIIFSFPLRQVDSEDAVICFVVTKAQLADRITDVTGGGVETGDFYYGNQLLMSSTESQNSTKHAKHIEMQSINNVFRADINPNAENVETFFWMKGANIALFIALALLLSGVCAYTAYRNYKPIRRQYNENLSQLTDGLASIKGYATSRNELINLETIFRMVLEKETETNASLESKTISEQRQMLWLALNGEITDSMQENLKASDISFPGSYFCVLAVKSANDTEKIRIEETSLISEIKKVKIEGVCLYPVISIDRTCVLVLCNLTKVELRQDLLKSLENICRENQNDIILGVGRVCDTLSQISASYIEAISYRDFHDKTKELLSAEDTLLYDKELVFRILRIVKVGNIEEATEYLHEFIAELKKQSPCVLHRKYIFADILGDLVALGRQLEAPLMEHQISAILTTNDIDGFGHETELIVQYLCRKVNSYVKSYWNDSSLRMVGYVQEHCLEYDISLEKISSEFGVNVSTASHMLREATGMAYKDFLIDLRIQHAKDILIQKGLSVAETCESVGYTSVPHFIKLFKKKTGTTPAVFQKTSILK